MALARVVVADFDHCELQDAQRRLAISGLPAPTLLVASGHGLHAYWRLAEPITDLPLWSAVQDDLASHLDSDHAVTDAPRIMRVPGTINRKPPVANCQIIEAHPGRQHELADIVDVLPRREPDEPPKVLPCEPRKTVMGGGGRAGDDFNQRASWRDILERHGWRAISTRGETVYWQRPGKEGTGISATTGHCTSDAGNDLLYVFSSNAAPLEQNRSYSKFAALAILEHGGDFKAAAAALADLGYESKRDAISEALSGDTLPDPPAPAWVTISEIAHRPTYKMGLPAVTTGYAGLDRLLDGGFRPGPTIIASKTGGGKSQLSGNIVRAVALGGVNVLHFTLEDSLETATWRMHAATSGTPMKVMLDGLSGDGLAIAALRGAYGLLRDLPIRLSDCRGLADILRTIRHHAEAEGQLIVLDQLSKVATTHLPATASTYERVSAVSEALRLAAAQFRLPIVTISQVNREAGKADRDLAVNDLRDSGMLEQDAVAVLVLNAPKEAPSCTGQPGQLIKYLPVKLVKNRFGPAGQTTELLWYPRIGLITDCPQEDVHCE